MVGDLHLGLVILVDGVELGHVAPGYEMVEIPFLLRHLQDIGLHRSGNNGVMGGNLLVIPGPALYLQVGPGHPAGQLLIPRHRQIAQDSCRILPLVGGQIFAVRTGIGGKLLLVELLGRIQHQLGRITVALARQHLQRREGKRQGLRLLLLGLLVAADDALQRRLTKLLELRLCHGLIHQPVLAVQSRLGILRLPLGGEAAVLMLENAPDSVIVHRLEILDFPLPAHHQGKGGGLHPADGQHQLVMACPAGRQGIGPRKVHANEPVRPGTSQRRLLKIEEILVVPQVCVSFLDALFVQGVQQDSPHGLLVPQIIKHLIHQQLSLTVRVAAVDNLVRLFDEPLHNGKLLLAVLSHI